MFARTRLILSAAVLAACAQFAVAADGGSARDSTLAPSGAGPNMGPFPQAGGAADAPGRRPLMNLLDQAGLAKPLDDARIQVYGHVEGSYTYNFDSPPTELSQYRIPVGKFIDNPGRVFDVENQKLLLNQLTLNIERTVDASKGQFDIGGHVELLYGSDARFIHSNGLLDNYDDDQTTRITGGPLNQLDVVQAYADFVLPVGNGLRIRAGKFEFFKQIDPNASVFFSHSFTFGGALPFTLTGAYATYVVGDNLSVDAGVSRGWDQSLNDNNGSLDVFGRVRYKVTDKLLLTLAGISGPEQDNDNGNWRTAFDFTATYEVNKQLTLLADVVYGQQVHPTSGGNTAHWYGVSLYAVQELCEAASLGVRLEWYRDEGGYTTGIDQTLYEATVGLTIRPFARDQYLKHLKIRPEVRIDYSNEHYFDGFSRNAQVTAAVDAIYNF
jgi:hypothetical protein